MYESMHAFISDRQWAEAHAESTIAGIAWLELFVLFDTSGHREQGADHIKDKEATQRAMDRKAKRIEATKRKERKAEDATTKPSLQEKMVLFRAIVRPIAAHDINGQKASWFLSEQRVR